MNTSPVGIGLIKRNEGCELTAYLDRLSRPPVWTIGYGDTKDVQPGLRITRDEAEERLARRLADEFEPGVLDALQGATVTQAQFDAMVSLAWNIGVGRLDDPETPQNEGRGFKGSSVARHHRAGDYQRAADAFLLWDKAGGLVRAGLVRRRKEERALYLSEMRANPQPAQTYDRFTCAKEMQAALAKLGLYTAAIDGIWGTRSRAAYNLFSRS